MKRRDFAGIGAGIAAASVAGQTKKVEAFPFARSRKVEISGKSMQELREEYRYWLFDDFLPFMDSYVIDHELGGFMCAVDRDGRQVNSTKRAWYEGRGIWVYSFLYNNLAREQKYLDVAAKSVDFIMKHKPEGDNLWPERYARDGRVTGGPDERTYGDLFIAIGLQEFAKATGDERYWDIAKETILKVERIYDRPDFDNGKRVQGVWMCLINTINCALEHRQDADLQRLVDRSIDAVLNYHFNPEFELNNERINHDFTRDESADSANLGHSIETFWMIMHEAVRTGNKEVFDIAAQRFRRHVDVGWDRVYGGLFESIPSVAENRFSSRKVLWLQGEGLIGSLYIYEHTGAEWAKEMYEKMYTYVMDKYPLKRHGFPLWQEVGDRKMTFIPNTARCEHYHHPRCLMLNILSLENMLKKGGKPSGLWV